MGLYDNIADQTKKLGVEAITKEHKVDLNMAVLIHEMAPTYGEAEVVKIIKDAMAAVRSQTLEGMKTQDQAKEKAELKKKFMIYRTNGRNRQTKDFNRFWCFSPMSWIIG